MGSEYLAIMQNLGDTPPQWLDRPTKISDLDAFSIEVLESLEEIHNPEFLGQQSPLAAAYFLGRYIPSQSVSSTAIERGNQLIQLLQDAANQLSKEQQDFLNVAYFRRNERLTPEARATALHRSLRQYRRQVPEHVWLLAQKLRVLAKPALMSETPSSSKLVGRRQILDNITQLLSQDHTVAITGDAGMGKTVLGQAIRAAWLDQDRAFWLTLRRDFNDQVISVAFSVASFLQQCGAPYSLAEIIGQMQQGKMNLDRILEVIRFDLSSLRDRPPLLCFDELELLQPALAKHQFVIRFLEDLRNHTRLLLIGQHIPLDVSHTVQIGALSRSEVAELIMVDTKRAPTDEQVTNTLNVTHGVAALVKTLTALVLSGEDAYHVIDSLEAPVAHVVLFDRLMRRLSEPERVLLDQLSAFRVSAPIDAFQSHAAELERLTQIQLIGHDHRDGLFLSPQLRTFLHERLLEQVRESVHLVAGHVHESHGDYAEAVHQYAEANAPNHAIVLWAIHSKSEIENGLAEVGLSTLRALWAKRQHITTSAIAELLRLKLAELLKLTGAIDQALEHLASPPNALQGLPRAYWTELQGDLMMLAGDEDRALAMYQKAIESLGTHPQRRIVAIHTKRVNLLGVKLNRLKEAQAESKLALLEADLFAGVIEYRLGNYDQARKHYIAASAIADNIEGELELKSWLYSHHANLLWQTNNLPAAHQMIDKALALHRIRKDRHAESNDLMTLAAICIMEENFEMAVAASELGLMLARSIGNPFVISGLAVNAGEALIRLNRPSEAMEMAQLALAQECDPNVPYALTVLGWVNRANADLKRSVEYFQQAADVANKIQDTYAEASAYCQLGESNALLGARDEARISLERSAELYERLTLSKELSEVRSLLAGL